MIRYPYGLNSGLSYTPENTNLTRKKFSSFFFLDIFSFSYFLSFICQDKNALITIQQQIEEIVSRASADYRSLP